MYITSNSGNSSEGNVRNCALKGFEIFNTKARNIIPIRVLKKLRIFTTNFPLGCGTDFSSYHRHFLY